MKPTDSPTYPETTPPESESDHHLESEENDFLRNGWLMVLMELALPAS